MITVTGSDEVAKMQATLLKRANLVPSEFVGQIAGNVQKELQRVSRTVNADPKVQTFVRVKTVSLAKVVVSIRIRTFGTKTTGLAGAFNSAVRNGVRRTSPKKIELGG